jgi:nuclear export mediator factor NEMF
VEEAIKAVNGLLMLGMDWGDIIRLIDLERGRGNPVAEIILSTNFPEQTIALGLRPDEDDEGEGQVLEIPVSLELSAYANARVYFEKKKSAAEKVYQKRASLTAGITDRAIVY